VAHDLAAVVGPHGWTSWESLTAQVDRKTVTRWVASGRLHRLQPGIYGLPAAASPRRRRLEAAVHATGGVVSHRSALALWGLAPPGGPLHLTVGNTRSGRGTAGVVLHRTRALAETVRRVDGLPVSRVERAVVDAWGAPAGLSRVEVRAAAIEAVRRRLCLPRRLYAEVERRPCLRSRGALVQLVGLLADGCQSELEIWGCLNVLRGPGMPAFTLQYRVEVAGQRFVLDAACEEVQLAVEMDGAAWHGSREQRERDIHRDALLATIGWQTLRFGYRRLTGVPEGCRRDIRAAYTARRRLMGLDGVR
jgi:very-short-patch-repair endonuclease/predicted transcriptional regulator of viral defense system